MLQPEDKVYIEELINCTIANLLESRSTPDYVVNVDKGTVTPTTKEDTYFVDNIKPSMSCWDILNWYRNLYYKEPKDSEQGTMAWAIDDCFMQLQEIGFFDGR